MNGLGEHSKPGCRRFVSMYLPLLVVAVTSVIAAIVIGVTR